jgi:hypothetical protein
MKRTAFSNQNPLSQNERIRKEISQGIAKNMTEAKPG